jgi:hypothetical protein
MVMREGLDEASGTYSYKADSELTPEQKAKIQHLVADAGFDWDEETRMQTVSSTNSAQKNVEIAVQQTLGKAKSASTIDKYKDVALGQTMKEKMDAGAIAVAKTAGDVVKIPKGDTSAIAAAEQNKLTYTTY